MDKQVSEDKTAGKSTKVALVFYDILAGLDLVACIFSMYLGVLIRTANKASSSSSSSSVSSLTSSLMSSSSSAASIGTELGQGLGNALILSMVIAFFVIIGSIGLILTIVELIWGTKQFVCSPDKKVSLNGKIVLGVTITSGVLLLIGLLLAIF